MLKLLRSRTLPVVGLVFALTQPALADSALDALTLDDLREGSASSLVANDAFLPAEDSEAAETGFNGVLKLSATEMQMEPALSDREVMGRDAQIFPGLALEFFTHEGDLVPLTQDVITPDEDSAENSFWQIIVQPGKTWSETGDDGWSRASFPFALMNRLEQETHNGVATFAYKDGEVTPVRFQVMQQTAPYYIDAHFKAWGALPAEYEAKDEADYEEERNAYETELADRFEIRPWSDLAEGADADAIKGFEGDTVEEWVVMHALVRDDTIYYQPSQTSEGPYPYPETMRFGVWSVTKSAGPGVGMLRLAEKYGDWVYELKLLDYLDIDPPHDGWEGVTFGDAVNMATGLGGTNFDANPNDFFVDYDFVGSYDEWYRARSRADKIEMLNKVENYPWGPGLVARYRDRDMFALGVAMDNFLKFMEGEDADIWDMIAEEVFEPIGIHHAPMNRTFEEGDAKGQPIMAWGWFATLDDMAKLARLLHDRGEHEGKQILHRERTESLFSVDGTLTQGPVNALKYGDPRYKMGFHYVPFRAAEDAETIWLPFMKGYVGNNVVLAPNGMTAIRMAKAWPAPEEAAAAVQEPTSMIEVMNRLKPFDE
ncbi:MAG TPA: hypothetical protein VK090_06940 [Paracoccaceae bacterium]|nr:hypothetical protein [Paracoccaceae bacterium]